MTPPSMCGCRFLSMRVRRATCRLGGNRTQWSVKCLTPLLSNRVYFSVSVAAASAVAPDSANVDMRHSCSSDVLSPPGVSIVDIDAELRAGGSEIRFVVIPRTPQGSFSRAEYGIDADAPLCFAVPAGWALDHDENQFQSLTFQRTDPIPDNGERRAVSIGVDDVKSEVVVHLVKHSATQGGAADVFPVRCVIPFAAVISSALASALSQVVSTAESRGQRAAERFPSLSGALQQACHVAGAPSANAKGYSLVHVEVLRRLLAASPIFRGRPGPAPCVLDPTIVAASHVLAPPKRWLHPDRDGILRSATQKGYAIENLEASAAERHRMATKRVDVLRSIARCGFAVIRQEQGVIRGVHRSDWDQLTQRGGSTTSIPIGSTYRCEATALADPQERLRRRLEGVEALVHSIFGVVRNTHYGGTSTWGDSQIIEANDAPSALHHGAPTHLDTAYIRTGIGLHTDTTYFAESPKLQAFACLHRCPVLSKGGENEVADGLAVAESMRQETPDLFELLTQIPVVAAYCKEERCFSACRPVIAIDAEGEVTQISYNPYDRAPIVGGLLSPRTVEKFYTAYARFGHIAKRNTVCFQLDVGDVLLFDNFRMLHARHAYSGPRIMGGAYVASDDTASAMFDAALRCSADT